MLRRSLRVLAAWTSIPFRASSRQGFAWYVSTGIAETVAATGALPLITWSQDGEDFVFEELFPGTGRYVDVGAHHPDRYSVTRKLYDRGWRGVNIDFAPGFEQAFADRRPSDTSVRALVGAPRTEVFTRFSEATLSTLDQERARKLAALGWDIVSVEQVQVRSLSSILDEVGFEGSIDLLSVDVEGEDLAVLASLDWDRWPVSRCLVEIVLPADEVPAHPISQFLVDRGLRLTRVWTRSCLFERSPEPNPIDAV